jgi:hypothetical protein
VFQDKCRLELNVACFEGGVCDSYIRERTHGERGASGCVEVFWGDLGGGGGGDGPPKGTGALLLSLIPAKKQAGPREEVLTKTVELVHFAEPDGEEPRPGFEMGDVDRKNASSRGITFVLHVADLR